MSAERVLPLLVALAMVGGGCSRSPRYQRPTKEEIDQAVKKVEDRISNAPPLVPATVYFSLSLENSSGLPILSGEKVIAFRSDGSIA